MARIPNVVIKTGFKEILCNFLRDSTVIKGKNLFESKHVFDVEESEGVIKGKVIRQTSVNAAPYNVSIKLTPERAVHISKCECLAGISGACKHIAAVVHFVNSDESITKTSRPQEWGMPSGSSKNIYKKGKKIMDLFPHKKEQVLTEQRVEPEGLDLGRLLPNCPILQITKFEKMNEAQVVCRGIFNDLIVKSVDIVEENSLRKFVTKLVDNQSKYEVHSNDIWKHMSDEQAAIYYCDVFLSKKEIETICMKTCNQSSSSAWFKERSKRVSASIANRIFKRKHVNIKFINNLYNNPSFKSKATTHGLMNEHIAFNEVTKFVKKKMVNSGLCIHEKQPWICGSPDGIVIDDNGEPLMVLEIKCPYKVRNNGVVDECDESSVPYILKDENSSEYVLKKNHMYYTQVQLLMYVTGLPQCLFYVYTSVNSLYIIVDRDEEFIEKCVKNLEAAYFNFILPAYIDKLKELD